MVINNLSVVKDGVAALADLRQRGNTPPRPDLILLNLNLPRKSGRKALRDEKRGQQ